MFNMKRPCDNCPFRNDGLRGWLRPKRAQSIVDSLLFGESFPCHKTVDYSRYNDDDDEQDEAVGITEETQHCAGAAILLFKLDRWNSAMQIGQRLGFWNPENLDLNAPVFDTAEDFVKHQGSE